MADFSAAEKVWADTGDGKRVGFVVGDLQDVNGDGKYPVQVGADVEPLTYREPDDREGKGSGKTFWKV